MRCHVPGPEIEGTGVPFSGHERPVPVCPKYFGDGHTAIVQKASVSRVPAVAGHMPDAGLVRVQAGH